MDAVLRALAVYAILLLMTRISGRRTLSQVTVFDFVLVLLIADTTQNALLGSDSSITHAVVLVGTLILTDVILSIAKARTRWISRLVDGSPTVLIRNGSVDKDAMERSRVGIEDVLQSARMQHGLLHLEDISWAILETSGNISVIPARNDDPADD